MYSRDAGTAASSSSEAPLAPSLVTALRTSSRKRSARAGQRRGINDVVRQVDAFFGTILPDPEQEPNAVITNIILLGDAPLRSGQKHGKLGHAKAPMAAIVAALALNYVVLCTREWYTSQHCCVCGSRLVDPYKVLAARAKLPTTPSIYAHTRRTLDKGCWKLRACLAPECAAASAAHGGKPTTPFAGPLPAYLRPQPGTLGNELSASDDIAFPAARIWQRDTTAALSIARAGLAALLGIARPSYLSRAHADASHHPVPRSPSHADLVRASSVLFSESPSSGSSASTDRDDDDDAVPHAVPHPARTPRPPIAVLPPSTPPPPPLQHLRRSARIAAAIPRPHRS